MEPHRVSILKSYTISHQQQKIPIPDDLIVEDEHGDAYLKMVASHYAIVRLVCPCQKKDMGKNPSLASAPRFQEFCKLVDQEIKKKIAGPEPEEKKLFDDSKNKKRKRSPVEQLPDSLVVQATLTDGSEVQCLGFPGSRYLKTPAVLLQPDNLESLLVFLREDCDDCKHAEKRSYVASGKYAKDKKTQE